MKNKSLIIIVSLLFALVVIAIATALIIRYRPQKLNNKKNEKSDKKQIKNILIVGDSQSAVTTNDGRNISWTYPNILREKLEKNGITIDVLAQVGKTTSWMKTNMESVIRQNKYDLVIIYGGGNDATNSSISLDTTVNNIQSMVNTARDSGAMVIVNLGYKIQGNFGNYNIMPITPYIQTKEEWIPLVERRKKLQQMILDKVKNAIFIPAYDLKNNTNDGIHPTATGHKIVAEKVYDIILKNLA